MVCDYSVMPALTADWGSCSHQEPGEVDAKAYESNSKSLTSLTKNTVASEDNCVQNSDGTVHKSTGLPETSKSVLKPSTTADGTPLPKVVLYCADRIQLSWTSSTKCVGTGLCNMGNTCFVNAVLQCLLYTPPLANYLSSGHHQCTCKTGDLCMLCELHSLMKKCYDGNTPVVKPLGILQKLRLIAKHMTWGRQEDAHEFLRYTIDAMQKACLNGYTGLDKHSKETSVVHQIFGGYLRSQVRCLKCQAASNTYDPVLDISVDLKNVDSVEKAMLRFVHPETLDLENAYKCERCKQMVCAQKKFTIHKAPSVLTIHLKRFDYARLMGGKVTGHIDFRASLDIRPYMSTTTGDPIMYNLCGVLVHSGFSCSSGHYYSYVKAPSQQWQCMNDSMVTPTSLSTVLASEAYILFYVKSASRPTVYGCAPHTVTKSEINGLGGARSKLVTPGSSSSPAYQVTKSTLPKFTMKPRIVLQRSNTLTNSNKLCKLTTNGNNSLSGSGKISAQPNGSCLSSAVAAVSGHDSTKRLDSSVVNGNGCPVKAATQDGSKSTRANVLEVTIPGLVPYSSPLDDSDDDTQANDALQLNGYSAGDGKTRVVLHLGGDGDTCARGQAVGYTYTPCAQHAHGVGDAQGSGTLQSDCEVQPPHPVPNAHIYAKSSSMNGTNDFGEKVLCNGMKHTHSNGAVHIPDLKEHESTTSEKTEDHIASDSGSGPFANSSKKDKSENNLQNQCCKCRFSKHCDCESKVPRLASDVSHNSSVTAAAPKDCSVPVATLELSKPINGANKNRQEKTIGCVPSLSYYKNHHERSRHRQYRHYNHHDRFHRSRSPRKSTAIRPSRSHERHNDRSYDDRTREFSDKRYSRSKPYLYSKSSCGYRERFRETEDHTEYRQEPRRSTSRTRHDGAHKRTSDSSVGSRSPLHSSNTRSCKRSNSCEHKSRQKKLSIDRYNGRHSHHNSDSSSLGSDVKSSLDAAEYEWIEITKDKLSKDGQKVVSQAGHTKNRAHKDSHTVKRSRTTWYDNSPSSSEERDMMDKENGKTKSSLSKPSKLKRLTSHFSHGSKPSK